MTCRYIDDFLYLCEDEVAVADGGVVGRVPSLRAALNVEPRAALRAADVRQGALLQVIPGGRASAAARPAGVCGGKGTPRAPSGATSARARLPLRGGLAGRASDQTAARHQK